MQSKLLVEGQSFQSWAIQFAAGEEIITGLLAFAQQNGVVAASFRANGAFSNAVLGVYDWQTKQYFRIPINEHVEIVTVMGGISLQGGSSHVHAHAALAKSCGVTVGGHLLEGRVHPELEVFLMSPPQRSESRFDGGGGQTVARI